MANQLKAQGKTDEQIAGYLINSELFRDIANQVTAPVVMSQLEKQYYNYFKAAGLDDSTALQYAQHYARKNAMIATQRSVTKLQQKGPANFDLGKMLAFLPALYFLLER